VWSLLASLVIAQGVWRPLAYAFASLDAVTATTVSGAALLVSLLLVLSNASTRLKNALKLACLLTIAIASLALSPVLGFVLVLVAGVTSWVMPYIKEHLPTEVDGLTRRHKLAAGLILLFSLLAIFSTTRLSIFIGDPSRQDMATLPIPSMNYHSCFSAYIYAAELSRDGVDNLYEESLYPQSEDPNHKVLPIEAHFAPFRVDHYAYPPPFLLLPRLMIAVSDDFSVLRALWFGLCGLIVGLGLWVVARFVNRPFGYALAPIVWTISMAVLQVGNVHMVVAAAAAMGMVFFEKKRPALGGALLAAAILSKISPGLLGIYLLCRRRWVDAAWTAAFGAIFTLLALLLLGAEPFVAFVSYELPRLSSGEALAFMASNARDIGFNVGPFGIPFKLQFLGLELDPWKAGARLGSLYTLVAVGLTITMALRAQSRQAQACAWLTILVLGGLQSSFAPLYVAFPFFWMLSLMASEQRGRLSTSIGVLASLVILLPLSFLPPKIAMAGTMVAQLVLYGLLLRSSLRPGDQLQEPEVVIT
jgi:hypothetical protein